MTTGTDYPPRLAELLETLSFVEDPTERASMLLSFADGFQEVPVEVATRPFPASHRVPGCESEAYVWAARRPDGTLKLYFAVESPSGVSAKALATILDRTLSGLHPEQIARISPDLVEQVFRQNISMGKGIGLMGMVEAVRSLAKAAGDAGQVR